MVRIERGTIGFADFIGTDSTFIDVGPDRYTYPDGWEVMTDGYFAGVYAGEGPFTSSGYGLHEWELTSGGLVTVPLDALTGYYTANYFVVHYDQPDPEDPIRFPATVLRYEFIVVEEGFYPPGPDNPICST